MAASAHSRNTLGARHPLVAHLRAVATRAAEFARFFGAAELAHAAGLYHDLGKFHPKFQKYLDWCDAHPGQRGHGGDHKGAGVSHVGERNGALQLAIVAHHGGLQSPTNLNEWRNEDRVRERVDEALRLAVQELPELARPPAAITLPEHAKRDEIAAEFFLRMLFSCLVDADFLDTEAHFNIEMSAVRAGAFDPAALAAMLAAHRATLGSGSSDTLTALRERIADACEAAGDRDPGIYRMTVPAGGGKTLAGMAFALRHAAAHGKRRIIVAIPYTSITDQTAKVYRDIFGGDGIVLEHSSAALADDRDHDAPATSEDNWQRLSAENWDAPIVVTTTVQFFQSLLGRRTSGARKLHNLADSVIILDEVQMLPIQHLDPLLDVLQRLVNDYGATVLLSTATQPAFLHARFQDLPEIAPDPPALFRALRRVEFEFPRESWSWDDAAAAMRSAPQTMMILNTKKDALAVLSALGDDDALHLSTLLCGAHRRDVLAEVKKRLEDRQPCRLVATQVVEAGVDVDFPVVFRAMGPLDRILQAAGRCNREGKLDHLGRVVVFRPADGGLPRGTYRIATEHTETVLAAEGWNERIHDPDEIGPWFEWLYKTVSTDREGIQKLRADLNYREVAQRFQMIEDDTEDVVVLYGTDEQRADVARPLTQIRAKNGIGRELMRKLQPYIVAVRRRDINRAVARGLLSPVMDGVWECQANRYHKTRGLTLEGADEELLMA